MATGAYGTDREFTIEPECPWYEAQQTYGPPNVNWCEPTVCSYINEPANTWSHLPLILVGFWIWKKAKQSQVAFYGICAALVGVFSCIYHATNNYLTQYFDFLGMFNVLSFALAWNCRRFFWGRRLSFGSWYLLYLLLHSVVFTIFDIVDLPVQEIIMLSVVPFVTLDVAAGKLQSQLRHYHYFWLGIAALLVGQAFAIIDIQRIYCEPENLFLHGHVMWHLLSSVSLLFFGLHIKKHSNRTH